MSGAELGAPRLLGRADAAKYLSVSPRTFDALKATLPHYIVGKRPKYKTEDLDAWLESQKVGNTRGKGASAAYGFGTRGKITTSQRGREILAKVRKSPLNSTRISSRAG